MPVYELGRVLGHEREKEIMRRTLERNDWAPFYIFEGPRGVGKATFALEVVRAYNCAAERRPCGECANCKRIGKLSYPDFWVIYPSALESYRDNVLEGRIRPPDFDYSQTIKIESIRAIREELSRSPYESNRRFILILNGENMTDEAQNAMLKILEEAPNNTTFIMISSYPEKILPTIKSRARRYRFGPLRFEDFQKFDFGREVNPELLFKLSNGSIGVAIELLEREEIWNLRPFLLDFLVTKDEEAFIREINFLLERKSDETRRDVSYLLGIFSNLLRDILVMKEGAVDAVINIDLIEKLKETGERVDYETIINLLERVKKSEDALSKFLPTHLVLLPIIRGVH